MCLVPVTIRLRAGEGWHFSVGLRKLWIKNTTSFIFVRQQLSNGRYLTCVVIIFINFDAMFFWTEPNSQNGTTSPWHRRSWQHWNVNIRMPLEILFVLLILSKWEPSVLSRWLNRWAHKERTNKRRKSVESSRQNVNLPIFYFDEKECKYNIFGLFLGSSESGKVVVTGGNSSSRHESKRLDTSRN